MSITKLTRSIDSLISLIAYSKKPWFGATLPAGKIADSIEIRTEGTICTLLTSTEDEDVLVDTNLTGVELGKGEVITYDNRFKAATFSTGVKFNLIN